MNDTLLEDEDILEYVQQLRGKGLSLPYEDISLIGEWLDCARSKDDLLLALEKHLPKFFAKSAEKKHPPSIKSLDKRIRKFLREQHLRH